MPRKTTDKKPTTRSRKKKVEDEVEEVQEAEPQVQEASTKSEDDVAPVVHKSWADSVPHDNEVESDHEEETRKSSYTSYTSNLDDCPFDLERADKNKERPAKELNVVEHLEVLYKKGQDETNVALWKGVLKLYRMLKGERLHPPRRERFRRNNNNYRNNKFRSRSDKDEDGNFIRRQRRTRGPKKFGKPEEPEEVTNE